MAAESILPEKGVVWPSDPDPSNLGNVHIEQLGGDLPHVPLDVFRGMGASCAMREAIAADGKARWPKARPWAYWVAAFTAGAALVLLFLFDPQRYGFYPRCGFHALTGLWCPGCGSLRATHQLLHGHFIEALRLNALFILALPFLGIILANNISSNIAGKALLNFTWRRSTIWLAGGAVALFTVVRNLPGH